MNSFDRFPVVPEMHDRLIATEADSLVAPMVTRDEVAGSVGTGGRCPVAADLPAPCRGGSSPSPVRNLG